jgi:hypothetical protein
MHVVHVEEVVVKSAFVLNSIRKSSRFDALLVSLQEVVDSVSLLQLRLVTGRVRLALVSERQEIHSLRLKKQHVTHADIFLRFQ